MLTEVQLECGVHSLDHLLLTRLTRSGEGLALPVYAVDRP